jgi:hypothetical protein
MGDAEVQYQRHRARLVREATRELDVPTSLTPTPNHPLCFNFVGCAKEVSNLINYPVVSLFDSRVSGTGANMIAESVDGKLFATTTRLGFLGSLVFKVADYLKLRSIYNRGNIEDLLHNF